jgi:hypothetical protein
LNYKTVQGAIISIKHYNCPKGNYTGSVLKCKTVQGATLSIEIQNCPRGNTIVQGALLTDGEEDGEGGNETTQDEGLHGS